MLASRAFTPTGYLEKLGFLFKIKARMEILSSTYQLYACGKISIRNTEFGQKDNFSR